MSQCQACESAAPSGLTICPRCESDTRARLGRQGFYYRQLLTVLTRMTRTEALNDGGRAASLTLAWAQMGDRFLDTIEGQELTRILNSLPPARRAANAMHSQRSLLVAWCRLLADLEVSLPADTIAAMGWHLRDHLPILRKHEAAGDLVNEIYTLNDRMLQVIDLPKERTRIKVGPCPNMFDNPEGHPEPCPGEIEAVIPADIEDPAVMCCMGGCRARWDTTQWTRTGRLIQARKHQLEQQQALAAQFIGRVAS